MSASPPRESPGFDEAALDYAQSLGFGPHEDFEPALFEPRPESLAQTPLASPTQPIYVSGPHEDVFMILAQLARVVGPENYQFLPGIGGLDGFFGDEDEDEDDDLFDGPLVGEIETTGDSAEEQ